MILSLLNANLASFFLATQAPDFKLFSTNSTPAHQAQTHSILPSPQLYYEYPEESEDSIIYDYTDYYNVGVSAPSEEEAEESEDYIVRDYTDHYNVGVSAPSEEEAEESEDYIICNYTDYYNVGGSAPSEEEAGEKANQEGKGKPSYFCYAYFNEVRKRYPPSAVMLVGEVLDFKSDLLEDYSYNIIIEQDPQKELSLQSFLKETSLWSTGVYSAEKLNTRLVLPDGLKLVQVWKLHVLQVDKLRLQNFFAGFKLNNLENSYFEDRFSWRFVTASLFRRENYHIYAEFEDNDNLWVEEYIIETLMPFSITIEQHYFRLDAYEDLFDTDLERSEQFQFLLDTELPYSISSYRKSLKYSGDTIQGELKALREREGISSHEYVRCLRYY